MSKKKKWWSYSRITTYEQCPKAYEFKYIDKIPSQIENGWAVLGSLVDSILGQFRMGEISKEDAIQMFEDNLDPDSLRFPAQKYLDNLVKGCRSYLQSLKPIEEDDRFKTLAVQEKIFFHYNGHNFIGYKDASIIDNETKDIYVVDDKISKPYSASDIKKKARQLYFYADIKNPPKYMMWNHFAFDHKKRIRYSERVHREVLDWANMMIHKIENDWTYKAKPDQFFCENLCSYSPICKFKNQ